MYKKLLASILSITSVFTINLNSYALETNTNVSDVYKISDNNSPLFDYPETNTPLMQNYKKSLLDKKVDTGKAVGLSVLYFGLGQLYAGDTVKGTWFLAGGTVLTAGLLAVVIPTFAKRQDKVASNASLISYLILIGAYAFNVRDAYVTADNINKDIDRQLLLSKEFNNLNISKNSFDNVNLTYKILDF